MAARAPAPPPISPGRPRDEPVEGGRRRRGWLRRLVAVLGTLVALLVVVSLLVWFTSPGVEDARSRTNAQLAQHHAPSIGTRVPGKIAAALIATEDTRFYSHSGLDLRGALRGALSLSKGGALGGATINAQLAKLLYTNGESGFRSSTQEVALAVKLDQKYTKRQILAMYFDAAYFGHGAYGLASASQVYFGVSPDRLTWAQSSMLAGLVNAPSAYDPTAHLTLARSRQRHVLDRLVETHVLTKAQGNAIYAESLNPAIPFGG
ncbi:MAG TPA: biosynthetic peptidoglycan transglycosylase [Frankiaceae bacterium]|nr:biosynthetic peptidoglycan transglycosylase [Frankiaceae bacterium]